MFTGIITDIGTVVSAEAKAHGVFLEIRSSFPLEALAIGASVACSGVCLTVVEKQPDGFAVEVSQETCNRTVISQWKKGTRINLERALRAGDELGGHIVSGHVDGLGELIALAQLDDNWRMTVRVPDVLKAFIAEKGSVTLDGVSMTVNRVENNVFDVNVIPHTWANTTFSYRKPGDFLHVEIDMLARYMARLLEVQHA